MNSLKIPAPTAVLPWSLHDEMPNKLSELVAVALADLRLARKQKLVIDLSMYMVLPKDISSEGRTTCSVCLAGSVLYGTYKLQQTFDMGDINHLPNTVLKKINTLDAVRRLCAGKHLYCLDTSLSWDKEVLLSVARDKRFTAASKVFRNRMPTYLDDSAIWANCNVVKTKEQFLAFTKCLKVFIKITQERGL